MNFVNVNLENMSPEEKQIFDRGLAIVNCKEDTNSLFKVMAFNQYDSASRYNSCRNNIIEYIVKSLLLMKKK